MRARSRCLAVLLLTLALPVVALASSAPALRPPAVPLVAHDPYFSIWSRADRLTDTATTHWTGARHSLISLVRVDGRPYRLMGDVPKDVPAMPQTGIKVTPTRTQYTFASPEVAVTLEFLTPALPDDLDVLSRPVTYVTWLAVPRDGRGHHVSAYLSASAELAVHSSDQRVTWSRGQAGALATVRAGSEDQAVLERAGDDTRIDWGYAYLAAPRSAGQTTVAAEAECAADFARSGRLPALDRRMPRAVRGETPALALVVPLAAQHNESFVDSHHPRPPRVRPRSAFMGRALIAYDDLYAINYFGRQLRPYWRRDGMDAAGLLRAAWRDYPALDQRCRRFDADLMADMERVGGRKYAEICALAYRQCLAACKLAADERGMPMLFPKENTSNGCISTVDVIYPMDPMFLLLSPMLARASVAPVLAYTASPLWRFRYAPHDLGTYPHATREVYGGDDPAHEGDRMPVEESGNMILLLAAIARAEGNPEFASRYWPQVTRWASYLEEKGFDPANQLCTDDFTGHLAHNANLSVKAIEALAAYGMLCGMRGDAASARRYRALAVGMARRWAEAADDGDHFRLAFDKPGTWSQKYNMVWDRILGLNVFGPGVIRKELAFYLRTKDRYGLALDNRQPYAKTDWALWTASLAESPTGFAALANPVYDFLAQVPDRHPMADLYWTRTGREAAMHARPVVGGVFIRMLTAPRVWRRWVARAPVRSGRWAPVPTPPTVRSVVATAERTPVRWRYTTERPADGWQQPGFASSSWQEGAAGFGAPGTPGAVVRTEWRTADIWLRREFDLPAISSHGLWLSTYHDEDVEVYLNGVLAARASGFTTSYVLLPIRPSALAALRPGRNLMAVHCHQTEGGQGIDAGIVRVLPPRK